MSNKFKHNLRHANLLKHIIFSIFIIVSLPIISNDMFIVWGQKGVYGGPTWGTSTSTDAINVQIGVFDKNRTFSNFNVLFSVRGPNGKQFSCEKRQNPQMDEWVFAFFPKDFKVSPSKLTTGIYSWKATIKGKVIPGGEKFRYDKDRGFNIPR